MDRYKVQVINEINEQNNILNLYEKKVKKINIIPNRLILVHDKIYYCIYTIDNSNIFFKIRRKKMIIKINENTNYDTSIEFDAQPEEIRLLILGLHSLCDEKNQKFDGDQRLISETTNHDGFSIEIEYSYYSDGWTTREFAPQRLINVKEK